MKLLAKAIAVGLAAWAWLASGPTALAPDRVVIARGADAIALNAIDVLVIVPDRSLVDHSSDTLLRGKAPGVLGPGLATSWKNVSAPRLPVLWSLEGRLPQNSNNLLMPLDFYTTRRTPLGSQARTSG